MTSSGSDLASVTEGECALVEHMATLRESPSEQRHAALVEWARSSSWSPALMLCEGWQGKLARDVMRALRRDLAADTPGKRWGGQDHAKGRASIKRLLGLGEADVAATYAALPFRAWPDDEGRDWIAGAIGIRPVFDLEAAQAWLHLDIVDVILWDPRTNEARLAGEHWSYAGFVMPRLPEARLKVWSDPGAFFRAWAAQRARHFELLRATVSGGWKHPAQEPTDSGLPGGLLIGNSARARWPGCSATTVIAGPGLTPAELHMAAIRAANLPNFEGGARGRG